MRITFVAGYGNASSDVPEALRQAVWMLASQWHEDREDILIGSIVAKFPFAVEAILNQYAVVKVPA